MVLVEKESQRKEEPTAEITLM